MNSTLPQQGLSLGVDVISTDYLLKIDQNKCRIQMSRIYYSFIYRAIYIALIILSTGCILYGLLHLNHYPEDLWYLGVELLICCFLFTDIVWRSVIFGGKGFFKKPKNVLDLVLVTVCLAMVMAGGFLDGVYLEVDSVSAMGFVIIRTAAQYIRLIILIKNLYSIDKNVIDLSEMLEVQDLSDFDSRTGVILLDSQCERYAEVGHLDEGTSPKNIESTKSRDCGSK